MAYGQTGEEEKLVQDTKTGDFSNFPNNPNQPAAITGGPDLPGAPIQIQPSQPQVQQQPQWQPRRPSGPYDPELAYKAPIAPYDQLHAPYEPNSPSFNVGMYMDRMREVIHNTQEHSGVIPTPNVLHDLVRAPGSLWTVRGAWQWMVDNTPVPPAAEARSSAADLPQVQKLPRNLQFELRDVPVVSAPAAPYAGLRYDKDNGVLINNTANGAPDHIDNEQLIKAAIHKKFTQWTQIGQFLAGARTIDAAAVAKVMPMIDRGDYEGAIAKLAAGNPQMANELAKQLGVDLPADYFTNVSGDEKWQNAASKIQNPEPFGVQSSVEQVSNLPVVRQYADFIDWTTAHTLYPALIQRAEEAGARDTSPRDQVLHNLLAMQGVKWIPGGGTTRSSAAMAGQGGHWDTDPKTLRDLGEQADWLTQELQSQGVNYIDVNGQKIKLFTTPEEAGKLDYYQWQKENPGSALVLGLVNPAGWIGPGSVIKAGRTFAELPGVLKANKALVDEARLSRLGTAEATAADIRKAAQAAAVERDKIADTMERWPHINRAESQLKPANPETAGGPGMKPVDLATQARVKIPNKTENMATLKNLRQQFLDINERLQAAKSFTETQADETARLNKSVANAQIRLNHLMNNPRVFDNKETMVASAQKSLENAQKRFEDAQALNVGPDSTQSVQHLEELQNKAIDALNEHVTSADLPLHPDARKLQASIDDINLSVRKYAATKNLKGQNPDEIDAKIAASIDQKKELQKQYLDASSPLRYMRPVMKVLQKQWADQALKVTDLEAKAQTHEELLARMLASKGQSRVSRLFNSTIHSWHSLDYDLHNPDSIIANGMRLMNEGKILRQDIEKEVAKGMGKHRGQLQFYMEHPEQTPPEIQSLVTDIRAFFADAANELSNKEIIDQIEKEYYPHWTIGQQRLFESATGFRGVLPRSAPPLKNRVQEEAQSALSDEESVGQYVQAITRVIASRHMRAAIKDGHYASGREMYIPGTLVPQSGSIPLALTRGKAYVYEPDFQGWVGKDVSDLFKKLNAPVGRFSGKRVLGTFDTRAEAKAAAKTYEVGTTIKAQRVQTGEGKGLSFVVLANDTGPDLLDKWAGFNNGYKKLAMRVPLVHMWNQLSAGMGVGFSSIPIGVIVSRHPESLALASREMFLQPSKMIADAVEKVIADNPQDQELVEALGFARKKENRVLASWDHFLWDSVVRNQQIGIWYTLRQRLIHRGYNERDAGIASGTLAQQIVGIQNPKQLSQLEKIIRDYVLFAASWNKKHVTIPAQAVPFAGRKAAKFFNPELSDMQAKLVESLSRRYILRYMLMAPLTLIMAQLAFNGTLPNQNEDGHQIDLEWTRLHNLGVNIGPLHANPWGGQDGARHYLTWPAMNFARFYTSKAQLFADDGPIGGLGQNLANITMPVPAWFIAETMNWQNLSPEEAAGQTLQQLDPWNRNLLGPPVKAWQKAQRGQAGPWDLPLSLFGVTGLKTYQGQHKPFIMTPNEDRDRRALDLEMALHMGVNPLDATPAQRAEAQKRLNGDALGDNISEFLTNAAGGSPGTGGAEHRLQMDLDQAIRDAVEAAGISPEAIAEQERQNKPVLKLLTPSEERLLLNTHPDIAWALNAHSVKNDEQERQTADGRSAYYNGLAKIMARIRTRQEELDAGLQQWRDTHGKSGLSPDQWRQKHRDNKTDEAQSIQGLQSGVPKYIYDPNAVAPDATPEESAYAAYHQISLDDPKYLNNDPNDPNSYLGTNVKQWIDDRNAELAKYSAPIQEYIKNRDNQNLTDDEKSYQAAAQKYSTFLDSHTWLQKQESFAMNLPATERRIYMELHPEISAYLTMKDKWWRANPEVANWYKPLDEYQWNGWSPDEQATRLASWVIDYRIGHPEYLTAWQRSLIENNKAQQQAIADWTPEQYLLYYDYLLQDQIDFSKRYGGGGGRSKYSQYGGSANYYKHYYNVPFNQQPNVFANSAPAHAGGMGGPAASIF